MERIRQQLMGDGSMYPAKPSDLQSRKASSSSNSSEASRLFDDTPPASHGTIVISSDEESGEETQEISRPARQGPPNQKKSTQSRLKPPHDPAKHLFIPKKPLKQSGALNVAAPQAPQRTPSNPTVLKDSYPSFPIPDPAPTVRPPWSSPPTPIGIPGDAPRAPVYRAPQPAYAATYDGEHVNVPDADPYDFMSQKEAEKALRELMSGAMEEETVAADEEDIIVPGFKAGFTLLPHQVQGRKWMKSREDPENKRYGGILADDMGLGKTIQTLVRIVEGQAKKSERVEWSGSTMVVVPLAVMNQWVEEAQRMTSLRVTTHHGASRTSNVEDLRKFHIVVTTYDVVKSEFGSYKPVAKDERKSKLKSQDGGSDSDDAGVRARLKKTSRTKVKDALFKMKWWRIVLDEAHTIKNRSTQAAQACFELTSRFKWCLTGTPMQNDVIELYSLLRFLNIKPYNDFERFNSEIAKPVKSGKGINRAMKKLQVVLKSVMLRRRKDLMINGKPVIELPPRQLDVISCTFSSKEQLFYDDLAAKMNNTLDDLMQSEGKKSYIGVLLLLLRLRQACDHCVLVSRDFKDDMQAIEPKEAKKGVDGQETTDPDDLVAAFGQLNVTRQCRVCFTELSSSNAATGAHDNYCIDCADITREAAEVGSTKIRKTLELLDQIDEESGGEDKTIIFSQFTSMLDLIEPMLTQRGIRYARYDGSLKPVEREEVLKKIKTDANVKVILISFKAGSTGLNLTICNRVILFDMWWNPALEDQAFDRAHRFGQKKKVSIYKLKVDGTVEDRILELQEKKRALTQAALSGDKVKNLRLDMKELLALFKRDPLNGDDDDDDD